MSGGSYNYLCYEYDNVAVKLEDLRDMEKGLLATAGESRAHQDTKLILTLIDTANMLARGLEDVWHAEEWYRSSDWSRDQVLDEIKKYEKH